MWIVGAISMVTVLGPGLVSGTMGRPLEAGGLDPSVSYTHAQQGLEPRIWLDRGVDPVLEAGDRVRIYYRTDTDAYVAILQIDTNGTTRMLYPRSPTENGSGSVKLTHYPENHYARADRDYRLLFPRSAYWNVDDRPGVGYFFVVTSPTPFDLSDFRYSFYDGGWDLSAVGSTVYSDPYVAMDDYVAQLIPDWEYVDYGLDFISYSVGGAHEYPRFLCYQCHGFRPYSTWNPYRYTCVDFRVVVYDDPYFYPSLRYRADRVVMGSRNPTRPRFGFKERAAGDPGTPITVVRQNQRGDPPPVTDPLGIDQRAGRGRVAAPPVVPRPTTTRRRDPSGGDESRARSDGGRVTAPRASNPEPRRPTLERRPVRPSRSTRSRPETPRPRPTQPRQSPEPDQPSTRRPANPRAGSSSRTPSTRPSTRPPPEPSSGSPSARPRSSTRRFPERSNGSPSARPAPRERRGTPPANRGGTRPPPRRLPSNGTR